jgi:tellurium resistance protein TerD
MGVVLSKGGSVSLAKQANRVLTSVNVGLGWDPPAFGPAADLDLSVVATGSHGRAVTDDWLVFYNSKVSPGGAIVHSGDSRAGAESDGGDDEIISIQLSALPQEVAGIRILVSIDDPAGSGTTFGGVANAYVRVIDNDTNVELARFDLGDGANLHNALVFAELVRDGVDWRFQAIGEGYDGGLGTLVTMHGINAG